MKPPSPTRWLMVLVLAVPVICADGPTLTGKAAFTDYSQEKPGIRRKLSVADLPEPYATPSADNGPNGTTNMIARPQGAWPQAPKGFKVELYATDLENPRLVRTAPNGDLFLADSQVGKILVFRGVAGDGRERQTEEFATGLTQPFGIAFYPAGPTPKWIYVGNTDSVVRFPYQNGDLKARGPAQKLADLPGGGRLRGGGHWTHVRRAIRAVVHGRSRVWRRQVGYGQFAPDSRLLLGVVGKGGLPGEGWALGGAIAANRGGSQDEQHEATGW